MLPLKKNSLQLSILNKSVGLFAHLFHISSISVYYVSSPMEGIGTTRRTRHGSRCLGTEKSSVGRQVSDQAYPARVLRMFGTSASVWHSVCVQIFVEGMLNE